VVHTNQVISLNSSNGYIQPNKAIGDMNKRIACDGQGLGQVEGAIIDQVVVGLVDL
jgi:hypothetical protein